MCEFNVNDCGNFKFLNSDCLWRHKENIQNQYERAMSRSWDHICDLSNHIYYPSTRVWAYKRSYLVGYEHEGYFIVSHFAPFSLREGMEMMREIASSYSKIIIAVPFKQARMMIKCGFEWIGTTHQIFKRRSYQKYVFTSRWLSESIKDEIIHCISLTEEERYVLPLP